MVTDVPTGPPVNVESFSCIAGRTTHAPVEVGQVVVRASGLALDCLHGQSCSLACVCDVLLQRTRYKKMTNRYISCGLACVCDVLLQRKRYNKMTTTDT